MRLSLGILVLVLGCNSEVITTSGGNGGTGGNNGGSGGSGATGGSGGNVGGTGGAIGGSGGMANGGAGGGTGGVATGGGGGAMGNLCDQGCAFAQGCFGFPVCGFIGLNCASGNFECEGQCILDSAGPSGADCAAVLSLNPQDNIPSDPTLQGCIQGCQGGGGAGGGGGMGGMANQACIDCTTQACAGDIQMLGCNPFDNSPFAMWFSCAQNCADPACYTACNAANPGASTCYEAVYNCQCTNCLADCQAVDDACNQPGGM